MIRDKYRIYAEKNSPNTVLSSDVLNDNKLVCGNGNKTLVKINNQKSIVITDANGDIALFSLPTGVDVAGKRLATDASGQLIWI